MKKMMLLTLVAAAVVLGTGTASAVFTPAPPDNLNFYNDYNAIFTDATTAGGLLYSLIPAEDRPLLAAFTPDTADINGGYTENPIGVIPNGMLDCKYELAIISEICKKPAGAQCAGGAAGTWKRDDIYNAWVPNVNTFRAQGGSYIALAESMAPALIGPLYEIIVGLVMLNDATTNQVVTQIAGILPGGSFNLASYTTFGYLAKDGDADGDGHSNSAEYAQFSGAGTATPTPGTYLSAVLNPSIPAVEGEGEAPALDSDGDGLTDTVETTLTHTNPFSADSDGDGVSDGMEVLVYGTNPNDANSKPSSLPATDYAGMILLVSLVGLAGVGAGLRRAYSVK